MKVARSIITALALSLALAACGQQQQTASTTTTAAPATPAAPPPTPADFKPCNTISFAAVTTVIGTRPTIGAEDVTGTVTPGWATCVFNRADHSTGPTFVVRVQKLPSGPQAARRHSELMHGIGNATAVTGDKDQAYTWSDGTTLYVEYTRGWWLTRRAVQGSIDAAARAKLLAAPRWP